MPECSERDNFNLNYHFLFDHFSVSFSYAIVIFAI